MVARDTEEVQAVRHTRAGCRSADRRIDMTTHHRRVGFARAFKVRESEIEIEVLLNRGDLNMARRPPPEGPAPAPAFFAFVYKVLKGSHRQIFLHADLPADDAPAVDRREVE